jgi:pimeloyl-ACP methyl ester carboxylesterase
MKTNLTTSLKKSFLVAALFAATLLTTNALAQTAPKVKNIVIVHGAFADGSGFKALFDILTKQGYNVSVVQNPLTSLKDDVDAANRIIDKQDGLVILVGHSWAGTVITQAGNNPKVVGLVYVAAFAPDAGENTLQWATSLPAAPENGILAPDANGIIYFDKTKFHAGFCADVSKDLAAFMYASQGPIFGQCFADKVTIAAFRTKPSYAIVATDDKAINPDIERNMYKRANMKVTEIKASHVVFLSQPAKVANVIITAANSVAR